MNKFIQISARLCATCEVLLHRRTELERERAARRMLPLDHTFSLADTLGGGYLHVCICVSRAVCIVRELELSLKFPTHGTSTLSHVPVTDLGLFQVPQHCTI